MLVKGHQALSGSRAQTVEQKGGGVALTGFARRYSIQNQTSDWLKRLFDLPKSDRKAVLKGLKTHSHGFIQGLRVLQIESKMHQALA
jgi:hypothetical protein